MLPRLVQLVAQQRPFKRGCPPLASVRDHERQDLHLRRRRVPSTRLPVPRSRQRSVGTDGTVFHTKKEWRKHEMLTQYTFYEKENHTFAPKKPGDVDGQAFDIRDLVGCEAAVCDATDMVQVDACRERAPRRPLSRAAPTAPRRL